MSSMLRNVLAGLSPREKRLLALTGVLALVMVCGLTGWIVSSSVAQKERDAQEFRELRRLVLAMEPHFRAAKQQGSRDAATGKPIPLRTLVEQTVRKVGCDEPETKELNEKTYPPNWVERAVEVRFARLGVEQLVRFMEEVERNKRRFPVAITQLTMQKDRRNAGMFRVTMVIATYERSAEPVKKRKGGGR